MNPLELLKAEGLMPVMAGADINEGMTSDEIRAFIGLALAPELGAAFKVGDRVFTRRFLPIAVEGLLRSVLAFNIPSLAVAHILTAQDPYATQLWLGTLDLPAEDLADILDRQAELDAQVELAAQTFEARRARWRSRCEPSKAGAIEVPPETGAIAQIEWAARIYGMHPHEVRQKFSAALLVVMFDAFWWANAMPPERQDNMVSGDELRAMTNTKPRDDLEA